MTKNIPQSGGISIYVGFVLQKQVSKTRVFSFFPEQVVDGGAESGRQIVQLVVSDDSAAVLDPADDLLRDVQPDDLELVGELLL